MAEDNTRDIIILEARKLFLSLGYHKTTMRQIAKEAGISTGPLYFHFRNKAEIFYYICSQAYDHLLAQFSVALESEQHAGSRLRAIFESYWKFFFVEPELFEILHLANNPLAGLEIPDSLRQSLEKRRYEVISIMERVIRDGVAAKELKPLEPRALALVLYSIAEGVFQSHQNAMISGCGSSLNEVLTTAVRVVGEGMVQFDGGMFNSG